MNQNSHPKRNPWPIAIITFFIVFAGFIATFIVWALGQSQDLVSENYYENEVRYQQQIDRMNRTQASDTQATVTFDPAQKNIRVALPPAHAQTVSGQIHFYRPANARLDHAVSLAVNATGVQTVDAATMTTGLWKVRVAWSANGQDYFFVQSVIVN